MSLDDRLRDILGRYGEGFNGLYAGDRTGDYITKLKQAFADEGYHDGLILKGLKLQDDNGNDLMTGQEWYDRFLDEINADKSLIPDLDKAETPETLSDWVLRIAKKASGIE